MHDKFHNQKLPHLIYAILWEDNGDNFAFVGKTTTKNTKALLRRHLRGEVTITAPYLHQEDWGNNPPRLIVLHSLTCTGAEAYRFVLCYIRLYEDFSWMVITHRGTDNQAYDMFPFTNHLYEELKSTASRNYLSTGITTAMPIAEPVVKLNEEPKVQMNIRLDLNTLCVFEQFCRKLGITQREGFVHLMHAVEQDGLSTDPLFVEQRNTIERQKKRIKELENKLQSKSRGQKADEKLKRAIANLQHLVAKYIDLVVELPTGHLLEKDLRLSQADLQEYNYPDSAGDALLELHTCRYSKRNYSAIFLYGKNLVTGAAIKLRYYPKDTYIGCSPKSQYCVKNERWLVSYQREADGAIGLVAAIPLPAEVAHNVRNATATTSDRNSLDEIIREANMYYGYGAFT